MVNIFLAIMFVLTVNVPNGIGVGVPHQYQDQVNLELLGNPIFYNWIWDRIGEEGYTPMIWNTYLYYTNQEELDFLMQNKSIFWLILNEPEKSYQANEPPSDVATMLSIIPTSNYACCGVSITRKGIEWLDEFITYETIPPVWHIHIYTTDEFLVMQQLNNFKDWMQENNVSRPIIISEINAYTNAGEQDTMLEFLPELLSDPDIVAIYWFSAYYESDFPYANLYDENGFLTELGQLFLSIHNLNP